MSHQRCAGWLQGLSFLVVCREVVGHRRCAGCVVVGRGVESALWRMRCGGSVASALWWMRCGGSVASALWWMQWDVVLAVFVEGFLLTFDGGVVILKVHIWEHSGPFGYLIPIWLVV